MICILLIATLVEFIPTGFGKQPEASLRPVSDALEVSAEGFMLHGVGKPTVQPRVAWKVRKRRLVRKDTGRISLVEQQKAWRTSTTTKKKFFDDYSTTSGPTSQADVGKIMRLKINGQGDLLALASAAVSSALAGSFVVLVFLLLRRRFPLIYAHRDPRYGLFDADQDASIADDAEASVRENIIKHAGLDAWMHVELHSLGLRIITCLLLVVPTILCPLHWKALPPGETDLVDWLTRLGMPTRDDLPDIPTIWVHAIIVWVVLFITVYNVYVVHENFLGLRFEWLRKMPNPRATTVLVQRIPDRYRTSEDLHRFFASLYTEKAVVRAYVVRRTSRLTQLSHELNETARRLASLATMPVRQLGTQVGNLVDGPLAHPSLIESTAQGPSATSTSRGDAQEEEGASSSNTAERASLARKRSVLEAELEIERREVSQAPPASSGFVQFSTRREARQAATETVISYDWSFADAIRPAPEPSDVNFRSLASDPNPVQTFFGWFCILFLFFAFIPLVAFVTAMLNVTTLTLWIPALKGLEQKVEGFHAFLEGVLATTTLNLLMGILPTCFLFIIERFFRPMAGAWADLSVERLCFYFQFIFVLLGVALGQGLSTTLAVIMDHPVALLPLLARTMPLASHFYLSYMAIGCFGVQLELLRFGPLFRFLTLDATVENREALNSAERYDTKKGQRVCRTCIMLVIPIVFCSLCPVILPVGWFYFILARPVFRYLYRFAETKKPDLGGAFWVHSVHQIFTGLVLYLLLMLSVICVHCQGDWGPPLFVSPTLFVLIYFWYTLSASYPWEMLPLDQAAKVDEKLVDEEADSHHADSLAARPDVLFAYEQPEVLQPDAGSPGDLPQVRESTQMSSSSSS